MPSPPSTTTHSIAGPAGELEALIDVPREGEPLALAVVCHPHPQHGGTMHNKVAHTLARGFSRMGFASVRFNFRGTEGSEGEWDNGVGEVDDARAAAGYLRDQYPDLPMWISGFSFGAAMAIKAAQREAFAGLVSVAPAVSRFAADNSPQPNCPWLVVQGDEDELVEADETIEWVNSLEPGPELVILPGAEHFFHGRLNDLREVLTVFVSAHEAATHI